MRCTAVLRTSLLAVLAAAVMLVGAAALTETMGFAGTVEAASEGDTYAPEVLPQDSASEEDGDPEANLPYLFAVFIITWAAFFGYVFVMSRRQNELRHEIDALKQRLAESEGNAETRAD